MLAIEKRQRALEQVSIKNRNNVFGQISQVFSSYGQAGKFDFA